MAIDTTYLILIAILVASNSVTALLLLKKQKQKSAQQSPEINEFLVDLLAGESLIKVTRIAPSDVFLRSPRHARK